MSTREIRHRPIFGGVFGTGQYEMATTLGRRGAQVFTEEPNQTALWADDELPMPEIRQAVTRRRREIFDKSVGRCHYCRTLLLLDGKWYVEHQMPRALGGTDDLTNLVAACTKCNLEKGDRTAIEYAIQMQSR